MLVTRTLHDTNLSLREHTAVLALTRGVATTRHYDTILTANNLLLLAGTSDKSRAYIIDYAQNTIGKALLGIKARYERTGKLGCNADEMKVLKAFPENQKQFWLRQTGELYAAVTKKYDEYLDRLIAGENVEAAV